MLKRVIQLLSIVNITSTVVRSLLPFSGKSWVDVRDLLASIFMPLIVPGLHMLQELNIDIRPLLWRIPQYYVISTSSQQANWVSVAVSKRGEYQVAIASIDVKNQAFNKHAGIWVSSDYGQTWVHKLKKELRWADVATSEGGRYMTAVSRPYVIGNTVYPGAIYISTNSGNSWVVAQSTTASVGGFNKAWTSISMDKTGSVQFASADDGIVAYSINYGTNWQLLDNISRLTATISVVSRLSYNICTRYVTRTTPAETLTNAFVSTVATGGEDGKIYVRAWTTSARKSNWVEAKTRNGNMITNMKGDWKSLSMSELGSHQVAVASDSIWYSTNGGYTWDRAISANASMQQTMNNTEWSDIASTLYGNYAIAVSKTGLVWKTTDYGCSWTPLNSGWWLAYSLKEWASVSMSGGGLYKTVCAFGDRIYRISDIQYDKMNSPYP
jgi:hypothetical protein